MANRTYEWKSCSKCNTVLEYRRKPFIEPRIGNVFVTCPKCGNVMLSGKKEYIMMSEVEKKFIYFEPILTCLIFMSIFAWMINEAYSIVVAIIFLIVTVLLYSIYIYFVAKSLIKKSLERTNDEKYLEQLKKYNMIK